MLKKKQEKANKEKGSFIDNFTKPVHRLKQAFGFIPKALPFALDQKEKLDKWSEVVRERLKNPAASNCELGKEFFKENKISDALTRFKIAIFMNKEYAEPYFWLGKCQLNKGNYKNAVKNFEQAKKLKCQIKDLDYFLQIYANENSGAKPTDTIKLEYFNQLSDIFDEYYVEHFSYIGHERIADKLKKHNEQDQASILELGCGNGHLGRLIKLSSPEYSITGLDFSKNMIANAKEQSFVADEQDNEFIDLTKQNSDEDKSQNIYDFLIKSDFAEFKNKQNKKYEIIISRGMINYSDNLKQTIEKIKDLAEKDALVIFYALEEMEPGSFKNILTEYSFPFFCNHQHYGAKKIKSAFKKASFELLEEEEIELEKSGKAVLLVFKNN